MIAGLGALNDVTITQASDLWELQRAIEETCRQGIVTRDVGGRYSTDDVTKAVIDSLA